MCRINKNWLLILILLSPPLGHAAEPEIFTAKARPDGCVCQKREPAVDEDGPQTTPFRLNGGEHLGHFCRKDGNLLRCSAGSDIAPFERSCPLDCLQIVLSRPNDAPATLALLRTQESAARARYAAVLPRPIHAQFTERFPDWMPVLVNRAAQPKYDRDYVLKRPYLEGPFRDARGVSMISIVYFFEDSKSFHEERPSWAFWDTASGHYLYAGKIPYAFSEFRNASPCTPLIGKMLDEAVLYGIVSGGTDAGGCCGPYSLAHLEEKGPVKLTSAGTAESPLPYEQCWSVNDPETGKFRKSSVRTIDGPANLRSDRSVKSEIIGECPDGAKVFVDGNQAKAHDEWQSVICGSDRGWTHRQNLR